MKYLIIVAFFSSLFSCGDIKTDKTTREKPTENLVGSTLDNINNSPHTIIKFEVNNELCFATINQFFKDYKNKTAFPYSLWVTVETVDKNDNGHPTETEASLFNDIEDTLINRFISGTPFCYIGRTIRNGYRESMFYVADKDKATEVMDRFIKDNTFNRKIEFAIESDSTWDTVSGLYQ